MKTDLKSVVAEIRGRIKPENRIFIKKTLAISKQVEVLLIEKGWNQKLFAQKLGKNESEVSKWLSGLHNITLQSIAKMEAILESDIITTPLVACEKYKTLQFITLKVHAKSNQQPKFSSSKGFNFESHEHEAFNLQYNSGDFKKEQYSYSKIEVTHTSKIRIA